ncbi:MAG TPA: methyltransferase domain-containing protein [Thermoleophilaceae bacterium]|nr:methyltransferase domain-containing protein [Thermoleophilaceae bacterium]
MDRDEYRQHSLESWNEMATVWDEHAEEIGAAVVAVGDWVIERLAPQPGETVLDIAAGAGVLTAALSERVGPEGHLISTDFAPAMVAANRRRGEERGLANVEYRQMDAERMDLEDASVDRAACRFGYMLMADPGAALAETRRVLRDGGPLAFAVWADPQRNPWVVVPAGVMMERGHMEPPDPEGPGMFSLAGREKIERALASAGLEPVEFEDIEVNHHYPSRDEMWRRLSTVMGPLAVVLKKLPDDERDAIRKLIEERAEPFRDGEAYDVPGAVHAVLARRSR